MAEPESHDAKGDVGQSLKEHREKGVTIHLFVRKAGKIDGRAAPFFYCGDLEFVSWKGEKPITVARRLRNAVPDRLFQQLTS